MIPDKVNKASQPHTDSKKSYVTALLWKYNQWSLILKDSKLPRGSSEEQEYFTGSSNRKKVDMGSY